MRINQTPLSLQGNARFNASRTIFKWAQSNFVLVRKRRPDDIILAYGINILQYAMSIQLLPTTNDLVLNVSYVNRISQTPLICK